MSKNQSASNLSISRIGAVMAVLFSLLLLMATGVAQSAPASKMEAQVAQLPLAFEPNQGQAEPQVRFLSRGQGYLLLLTKDEAVLALGGKSGQREMLRLRLAGSNRNAEAVGLEMLPGKTNYFLGNDAKKWRTNISNYTKVRYREVYPGIDLLYYGKQNSLEHDFIVAPNADPGKIALDVKGAQQMRVDEKGNLLLTTASGVVQLDKPFIFQTDKSGKRVEIAGGFALKGNRVSFQVGAYDKSRELVIDPVLNYATYFGGDATTTATAIAVDANGNAYFTGNTLSTTLVASPACVTCTATPNNDEIFVAKLNATGSAVTFLSIIGGSGSDTANAIAVDSGGNAYVTGQTSSTNFPTTGGAYLTVAGNNTPDAYVVKLQNDGSALNYSSYLNGGAVATDHADVGRGIAVDASNNVYVVGSTASTTFLPASFVNGAQVANADATGATTDAFLVKINTNPGGAGAADLLYGTYWGGTANDAANAIALVSTNHAVVVGKTLSSDFPTDANADDTSLGGTQDGFATNFVTIGSSSIASSSTESGSSGIVCTDSPNNSISITLSSNHNLAVGDSFAIIGVGNSANITFNGFGTVATVVSPTKITYTNNGSCNNNDPQQGTITPGTSRIVGSRKYSTFVGGALVDEAMAVALDGNANAYITGSTTSTGTFATNFQNAGGGTDAFIEKLNASGSSKTYSAFIGGAGDEVGTAIAVNKLCTGTCEAWVGGTTTSTTYFNSNALQGANGGGQDGFLIRMTGGSNAGLAASVSSFFGGAGTDAVNGIVATYSTNSTGTNIVYMAGSTSGTIGASTSFGSGATVTASAPQGAPVAGAAGSAIVAKIQASSTANPVLGISGSQTPTGPVGQASTPVSFASAVTYNWVVTNTSAAKGVTVNIPVPQTSNIDLLTIGTPGITGTGSAGTCTKAVGTATAQGGVTCVLGDLSAGGNTTIALPATPTAQAHCANAPCTDISQVAKVASAETGSLATSGTVTSTVVPVVNLDITGNVTTDVLADAVYNQGSDTSATYTITVTNNSGTTNAAVDPTLDILLTADYPTNFVVDSTTPALTGGALAVGTPACKDNVGGHQLQCNIDTIAAAGTSNVTITGHFTSAASNPALPILFTTSKLPSNNATEIYTSTGTNTNKAVTIDYVALSSDMQITSLVDDVDPIQAGQTLTHTISFRNNGPTDATNVIITTTFTQPLVVSPLPAGCTQTSGGANLVCAVGDVAAMLIGDPDLTLSFTAVAPLSTSAASVTNTSASTIAADQFDGTANNVGNQTTVIERRATLSITTATSTTPVAVGGAVTFNVTVHNDVASPSTASNVVATITLPAGFTGIASGTSGCVIASQVVTCTQATLAANANYAISITANAPTSTITANDDLSTTVSVNSNGTFDPTGLPHLATIHTFVTRTSDLVLTTATDNSPVRTSGPLTFSTLVTNNGPDPANNVKVVYTLPNANYTAGTNDFSGGCVQVTTTITCSLTGTIANAGTSSNSLSVTPDPAVPGGTASVSVNTTIQVVSTTVTDDGAAGAPGVDNSQTVNSTIERQADLAVTGFGGEVFSATPAVSTAGQITYTLAVRNNGPDLAKTPQVKFDLTGANGFGFVSTTATNCSITNGGIELTCNLADIPSGNQVSFNAIITPPAGFITSGNSATLTAATATVTTIAVDAAGNNSRGPATTEVQRQANLRASGLPTSFAGPVSAINSSATATYNIIVRNDGPDATTNTVVKFTFTSAIASLDTSPAAVTAWGGLGTCVATQLTSPAQVTCTNLTSFAGASNRSGAITISPDTATLLAATNSATFNVVADISSVNAYDNGTAGAPGGDNTSASVPTTVQRQADLQVLPLSGPASLADGGTLTYTITVQNNGPDAAASVRVVDALPIVANGGYTLNAGGASFVAPGGPGLCTANQLTPQSTITCMLGAMNSGQSATITVSGIANIDPNQPSQTFNNTATVDASVDAAGSSQTAIETNGGNNTSPTFSTVVSRSADLLMTVADSTPVLVGGTPDPAGAGAPFVVGTHESIRYDITVGNNLSSATTVSNAVVTTTLPSTLTFSSSASGCSAPPGPGTVVTCSVAGTLPPGATASVSFIAIPAGNLPVSGSSVNIAITPSIGATGNTDPDGSNNAIINNTTVQRVSDLSIVQTAPALPIAVTTSATTPTFTYTWQVTNNGPSNATGVSVTNTLPADLKFVSGSWLAVAGTPGTAGGSCTGSTAVFGGTITCNLSTIDNGATVTITVTVRPQLNTALANKQVGNQPSVNGLVQDNVGANNSDTDQVELRGVTDLQVTITPVQDPAASAGQVLVGNNQTWAVTVTNNGPYPAGGVVTLTDTIGGTGVTTISVLPAPGGTFGCVGQVCTVGTIPPSPAPGSTQVVNVITTTPASAVTGQTTVLSNSAVVTQYSNGATVASDVTDPTPANNTVTANVTGRAAADVGVSQTAPNGTNVGLATNTVKFRMQVSNVNGRSDATGVVLTNSIVINPNGAVPTTATGSFTGASAGNCNAATGLGTTLITITCPLGAIPTGQTTTVDLTLVPVLDSGSSDGMTNTPSVAITEVDPVAGNNAAAALGIKVSTVSAGQQTFSPTNPNNGQPIPSVVITGFVSNPGATTMLVSQSNPGVNLPAKYQFGSNNSAQNWYTITNTTIFTGGVQLCILTPETFFQPSKVRLWLVSGGTPTDVTTTIGYNQTSGARQVCATTPTLSSTGSTFVVMEPINTAPDLTNAAVIPLTTGGKGSAGTSITLDGTTVLDPDTFRCMKSGVDAQCVEQNTLIFRWVGNFTDVATIDPATGLKVITKNCSQNTTTNPFFDGKPCNEALTSLGLGSNVITLQVFDEFYVANPPAPIKQFTVGSTGSGSGGVTSQTVSKGQSGTFSFSYTYGANTTFAFTGTPSLATNGITCTAQPLTYTGAVGGTQTSTVTVLCSTSPQVFAMNSPQQGNQKDGSMLAGIVGLTGLPLVGMVLMPGRSRRKRMLRIAAIFALIALMVVFQAACGGGSGSGSFGGAPKLVSQGTALGDYVITVAATPAPTSGNPVATLTLKVQ